jgi:DNA polymerase III subunit delta'
MTNWNLLGHAWAVDMLHQHVARNDIRHAYLITGASGLGKRTLALRLAQALNCENPISVGTPCFTCRTCKQIESMTHPDLTVIQSEAEGGTLKVDQIREVQRTINLRPYQSNYRVSLFLRFHEANDSAANALLKTLEEAPAHAILILTAESPEQLLPTINSRCEILRLRPLPIETVTSDLMQKGLDEERARLLAHISGSRPGFARKLVDDVSLLEKRDEHLNDLQTLLPSSRVEKFAYADKLAKDKNIMRQTILVWLSYWRDILLRVAGAETPLINIDRNMEIEFLAGRLDLSSARKVVSNLESTLEKMDRNVNSRLLAEVLLLDLPKI